MHDVMRKRLWRKLDALPDDQLYQVLDFIEFLEAKYAAGQAAGPSGLQRFAERLEDGLRARSLAPRAMTGTMKLIGTAGRMLDGLTDVGQQILGGGDAGARPQRADRPPVRSAGPEKGGRSAAIPAE